MCEKLGINEGRITTLLAYWLTDTHWTAVPQLNWATLIGLTQPSSKKIPRDLRGKTHWRTEDGVNYWVTTISSTIKDIIFDILQREREVLSRIILIYLCFSWSLTYSVVFWYIYHLSFLSCINMDILVVWTVTTNTATI